MPVWNKRPGDDWKPFSEFLCDPGPWTRLRTCRFHQTSPEVTAPKAEWNSSWGAWAVSRELILRQRHPVQHPLHVRSCCSEVSASLLTRAPEAVNKKASLELHLSCFPQSLKMFQKTGLKLNLMTCASFYPWTSGLKSSWCSII